MKLRGSGSLDEGALERSARVGIERASLGGWACHHWVESANAGERCLWPPRAAASRPARARRSYDPRAVVPAYASHIRGVLSYPRGSAAGFLAAAAAGTQADWSPLAVFVTLAERLGRKRAAGRGRGGNRHRALAAVARKSQCAVAGAYLDGAWRQQLE